MKCQENLASLRTRLKNCKSDMGISLVAIAKKCAFPADAIYHFHNGSRPLNEERCQKLSDYLESLGY